MIRFEKVVKSFRRQQVLKGVDLDIALGDRVALVGSNGAGKTTFIRCLLGEYTCQGHVSVDGMNPREHRREVLSRIGFVPQLPPPLKMPVHQLIHFAASLSDSDPRKMEAVAERLGLDVQQFKHQPFVKLSGGQKQKLLISIALGRDVELLVLDEPAANLDPEARGIFFELLAEKQEDTAMIISSHRLDEVAALVNRVIEMDQGIVVLDDRVEDAVDLNSRLSCRIELIRADEAFAKSIQTWGFNAILDGAAWEGSVAGPDRLRFLGMLSRYAGVLKAIHMDETNLASSEPEVEYVRSL
ncbi:MAG: ABC transporter ATP-binding protein [Candidatus Sedimenticola sp. PURPLELP]